mgnify:CR=1 FL=1
MGKTSDTVKIEKFGISYMKFRAKDLIEELNKHKKMKIEVATLEKKIVEAAEAEEYEKAALYRDRLKALDKCVAGSDCSDSLSQGECCL